MGIRAYRTKLYLLRQPREWLKISIAGLLAFVGALSAVTALLSSARDLERISAGLVMTVFLREGLNQEDQLHALNNVREISSIEEISVITSEQAQVEFEKEFGATNSDLLPINPLPTSFVVRLKPEYRTMAWMELTSRSIRMVGEVDEVKFRTDSVNAFFTRSQESFQILSIVGTALCVIFLFLIHLTMRNGNLVDVHDTHTLYLLGAKRSEVAVPLFFLFNTSSLIGVAVGAVVAVAISAFGTHLPLVGSLSLPTIITTAFGVALLSTLVSGWNAMRLSVWNK